MTETRPDKPTGRTSTLLSATIVWAGGSKAIFVRNISEMGALVECDAPLETDTLVHLMREGLEVEGRIVWAKHPTYGVKFETTVEPAIWLGDKPRNPAEPVLSSMKQLVEDGTDISNLIDQRLSEEIEYAVRLIEMASNSLIRDAFLSNRHPTELQNLSIAVQMLSEIGLIVKDQDKLSTIEKKATGPMRSRIIR